VSRIRRVKIIVDRGKMPSWRVHYHDATKVNYTWKMLRRFACTAVLGLHSDIIR